MTTTRRKRNKDEEGKFFLYVFFHSSFTGIGNLFTEDT